MSVKVRMFQFKQFQEESAMQFSCVHVDSASNGYIISVFRYRIVVCHLEQARRKLIKAWAWRHKNLTGCHCPCRTHFFFPPEHLRACQEGMAVSQLKANVTFSWVTCQRWSQGRLEGIAVQCSNHTYRLSLDITCCPETPPFLSVVLVPKATGVRASAPSQLCVNCKLSSLANTTCHFSISFGWTAEVCPNASNRINAPGFGGWYPDTTANTPAISPHCYTATGFWP